jgi:vacuolar-type H+-ATPase subunit E/Vma4
MTLAPAHDALLTDARATAHHAATEARAEVRERLATAAREADELIANERAHGEAEGREQGAVEEGVARTLARLDVLAARREGYEALRRGAREAALELRDTPDYGALLERLAAAARRDLGEDAQLELDPPAAGGVRASRGSRRVDYTLVALADRCVEGLGPKVRRLWT